MTRLLSQFKNMRFFKESGGFALLLTILIISLIVAITLQFNTAMRTDLFAAANLRDGIRLGYIAKSGFNCALAVLFEDTIENESDSFHEDWASSEILSANSDSMFQDGHFKADIMDFSGRIQINQLVKPNGEIIVNQKELFQRFFGSEEFELEPEAVGDIIDALKDWIDADNEVTKFGAENSYYQSLDRPYPCKNGRLESLEELLYVKGVTKELFFGNEEKPGVSNYISVYGDGKININTAAPIILSALSLTILGQDMAEDWVEYRENDKNDLSKYQNYPGMSGITKDQKKIAEELLTNFSIHFEIKVDGFKELRSKRVSGVVERNNQDGTLQILSWKIK